MIGGEGGYTGFAGKDASRAFISGKFNEEGLVEEVEGRHLARLPASKSLAKHTRFNEKRQELCGNPATPAPSFEPFENRTAAPESYI